MSDKPQARSPHSIDTLIGDGMFVTGDVVCTGVLRVQGEIVGTVSCRDGATLIVDSAGSVTGTVDAAHVSVRGRVLGPVQSGESIEVHRGGAVSGDVSFSRIAIHAGGIVEGLLTPGAVEDRERAIDPRPALAAGNPTENGGSRAMRIGLVVVVALAVAAGAWVSRNRGLGAATSADAVLPPDVASAVAMPAARPPTASASSPASVAASAASSSSSLSVAEPQPVAEPEQASASVASGAQERDGEDVAVVKGANPNRPPGVFLLVSNTPSVLYRKKRGEPGDGARVAVSGGEKVSVSIAPDDLIRVAQGQDAVIFFQGAKVPQQLIASGTWIGFVPR